jgi:superfamily II DNA/RNA helicase
MPMSEDEEDQGENCVSVGSDRDALSESNKRSFRSPAFSLSNQVISNLEGRELVVPTEVQLQVIPKIRNERGTDLCVNAPTGSGKTLAYALPIVEVRTCFFLALLTKVLI